MVVYFKTAPKSQRIYPVTIESVEEHLGRRAPWFQSGSHRDDDRHFAVCPYCDNPIQLKGLYRRTETSPRPHGSHVGKPIDGFAFDAQSMQFCPYKQSRIRHAKDSRRTYDAMGNTLIDTAIAEFDRIVLILRDDYGFRISDALAGRMLESWFKSKGFLYQGAHLRNLPWMIGYFAKSENLFRQRVGQNEDLAAAIRENVPQAEIDNWGNLIKGSGWYCIMMQTLHHRSEIDEDGDLSETLQVRVQDFTDTNDPDKAPTLHRFTITFQPDRFEALMNTPADRAKRNEPLLALAQEIAKECL